MMEMTTLLLIHDDFFRIEDYQGEYSSEDPDYAEGAIEWRANNLNILSQGEWGSVELMWGQLVWGIAALSQEGHFEGNFSGRKLLFAQQGDLIRVSAGVQYPESTLINQGAFLDTFAEAALNFYTNLARIRGTTENMAKEIEICQNLKAAKA